MKSIKSTTPPPPLPKIFNQTKTSHAHSVQKENLTSFNFQVYKNFVMKLQMNFKNGWIHVEAETNSADEKI